MSTEPSPNIDVNLSRRLVEPLDAVCYAKDQNDSGDYRVLLLVYNFTLVFDKVDAAHTLCGGLEKADSIVQTRVIRLAVNLARRVLG